MFRANGAFESLSDDQLLVHFQGLVRCGYVREAELVAHLGEIDARRLYLAQAYSSMFDYCVRVLHFAEGVAYKRIAVARAGRRFPELLAALERGDLHLTAACLIAPHLGDGSAAEWIAIARHATAREIKQRIADRKPQPDVKALVRKIPTPRFATERVASTRLRAKRESPAQYTPRIPIPANASTDASTNASTSVGEKSPLPKSPWTLSPTPSSEKARCEPLGAERYCIRFVADAIVNAELQELRALLRHSIPDGDVAKILARAVSVLLEQTANRKSEHVPRLVPPRH